MSVTMDGLYVDGEKVVFHPEDILTEDPTAYTEEIGEAVTEWLEENVTGGEQVTDTTLTLSGVPADAKVTGDEIDALKEDLSEVLCPNLMGMTLDMFPVFLKQGTYLTVSTSDGSTAQSGAQVHIRLYDASKNMIDYYTVPSAGASSRTIQVPQDTYYLDWNQLYSVPLMVNAGTTAQNYVTFFPSVKIINEEITEINGNIGRSIGTKAQDLFNIVSIDTYSKYIKLVRVGSEFDRQLRQRKYLCYYYGNDEFDASESYAMGKVVSKDDKLYQFTVAHSGAWTGTDAVEIERLMFVS